MTSMNIDNIEMKMRDLVKKIKDNPEKMTTDELGITIAEVINSIVQEIKGTRNLLRNRI